MAVLCLMLPDESIGDVCMPHLSRHSPLHPLAFFVGPTTPSHVKHVARLLHTPQHVRSPSTLATSPLPLDTLCRCPQRQMLWRAKLRLSMPAQMIAEVHSYHDFLAAASKNEIVARVNPACTRLFNPQPISLRAFILLHPAYSPP
eukprot:764771-Hanusia_phi.AAC.2